MQMSVLRIDRAVLEAYPEVAVAVLVARGLTGGEDWPEAVSLLNALESDVASGAWTAPDEADERIASWHAVYRKFSANPRRVRPSVDALCRRLTRTGRLPRINGPVDAYNAVSVRNGLPAGAFDLDAVQGDVVVRIGAEGDRFTPLGEPDEVEEVSGPEVVYADEVSVLTRFWNHRDADRTKVTPDTKNAVFILESARGAANTAALEQAMPQLAEIVGAHAQSVTTALLGVDHAESVEL